MTRTHSTARRSVPQSGFPTTLSALVCIAAGVCGGFAVQQLQTAAKEAKVLRLRTVVTATPTEIALAPAPVAQTRQQPQVQSAAELRARLRWVTTQVGQRKVETLDPDSRLLLARSAAVRAGLADVGLDYRDVYGVIHAESSWVARPGMGRNGVVSHGLAQFEPATARAVGLRNPADPVEAVHASALLLKEAAVWSARRIDGLKLDDGQAAQKLREGISVYYNLSSRGRQAWHGLNSHQLPIETRLHIRNVQVGAARAGQLTAGGDGGAAIEVARVPLMLTVKATAAPVAAAPHVRVSAAATAGPARAAWVRDKDSITLREGTIRWSSSRETVASRS